MRLGNLDTSIWICRLGGARLSTGASREASVDNGCLGQSMQVGGSRELGVQAKLFATKLDTWV